MAKGLIFPTGLTGNTGTSLDSFSGAADNDAAFSLAGGKFYYHYWDSSSTAAADSPAVVQPASLPASGRWLLGQTPYETGPGSPPSGVSYRSQVSGLVLSNNATDGDNDIDVSPGSCMDNTNTVSGTLDATMTKRLDASWVAGTGNGGLLDGSKAASTSYRVVILIADSDGAIDVGFIADGTSISANLPSGYSSYMERGFIVTDASSNIVRFTMSGRSLAFHKPGDVPVSAGIGTTYTSCDVSAVIPVDMVETITFSLANNYSGSNWGHLSYDGTNDFQVLGEISGYEPLAAVAADTVYAKCSGGTMDLNIAMVRLA